MFIHFFKKLVIIFAAASANWFIYLNQSFAVYAARRAKSIHNDPYYRLSSMVQKILAKKTSRGNGLYEKQGHS